MEKNKQQTAIDWFIEKIGYQKNGEWYIGIREDVNIQHWVDQVRQMEKDDPEMSRFRKRLDDWSVLSAEDRNALAASLL